MTTDAPALAPRGVRTRTPSEIAPPQMHHARHEDSIDITLFDDCRRQTRKTIGPDRASRERGILEILRDTLRPLRAVKTISCSQGNDGYGAGSGHPGNPEVVAGPPPACLGRHRGATRPR